VTHVRIVNALAVASEADAAGIVFEYVALTQVEAGRRPPRDVTDLPAALRRECADLAGFYGADGAVFLAYLDGELAGCVGARRVASAMELRRLYVRERFRRLGVARALMDAVHSHARAAGVGNVVLDVMRSRTWAIHLYRRLGYREVPCPDPANPYDLVWFERDVGG
jgi:ribosomal protein S18 acetylase RimI-like enzyme